MDTHEHINTSQQRPKRDNKKPIEHKLLQPTHTRIRVLYLLVKDVVGEDLEHTGKDDDVAGRGLLRLVEGLHVR